MDSAAIIRQKFNRSFILSEEDLRKIEELVTTRLGSSEGFHIEFRVRRQDGMLTSYISASEVLAEEHAPRNPVEALNIICETETTRVDLSFDAKEEVVLSIQSGQRDVAYLLLADLRDYLKGEVIRRWGFRLQDSFLVRVLPIMILLAVGTLYVATLQTPHFDPEAMRTALRSTNATAKLDYLIQLSDRRTHEPDPRYIAVGMLLCLFLPWLTGPLVNWVLPESVFYWGKVAIKHDERTKRRGRILWGVLIAFIVGIAVNVVTDSFKRDSRPSLAPAEQIERQP